MTNKTEIYSLYPYQIKNRELFYAHKEHPDNLNPKSIPYKKYWSRQLKRCIEGYWVDDNGTWVFMMPKLYFYINISKIIDIDRRNKSRKKIHPRLRDIEWIFFTYILCCQGFSGFSKDDKYTSNKIVKRIEEGEDLNEYDLSFVTDNCYNSEGKLKKYIDPWEYLTRTYLIDDPAKEPLGRPLYDNSVMNAAILGTRGVGKTFSVFAGDLQHEFVTGGVKFWEDVDSMMTRTLLFNAGGPDQKKLQKAINAFRISYEDMPGAYLDKFTSKRIPSPFYRKLQGSWSVQGAPLQHFYKGRDGKDKGSMSTIEKSVFTTENPEAGVADRYVRIYCDEFGLVGNAQDVHAANKNSLIVGDFKVGMAIYTGCVCAGSRVWNNNGDLVNIEDLKQEDGIIGYSNKDDCAIHQSMEYYQVSLKPCYRITTNMGRTIECSDDHPLFIRKRWDNKYNHMKKSPEWTRTDEVKVGDGIGVIDEVNIWSDKTMFDPRLIGRLISDGTCGQSGIYKRLPPSIFSMSKDTVCELIGGLYDGDGCIYYNETTGYKTIKYTSISKGLIDDIHILLTKLGIHGRITTEKVPPKGKHVPYSIYIKDMLSCKRFSELITLHVNHKQENLNKIGEHCNNQKRDTRLKSYHGLRWEKVKNIESIGIREVYNIEAKGSNTYIVNGIHTHNTSGNFDKIQQPRTMFTQPDAYDIFSIPNYWENPSQRIGLFIPDVYVYEAFKDENGNTKLEVAYEHVMKNRAKLRENSKDLSDLEKEMMYRPLVPSEMFMIARSSTLPAQQARDRLVELELYGTFEKIANWGNLEWSGDYVNFAPNKKLKPIRDYPVDQYRVNLRSAFVVYEQPIDNPPRGLYKIIYDPVKDDDGGTSLASIIVHKGIYPEDGDAMQNTIVAEWIGRYDSVDEIHDLAIKATIYYGGKLFPETNVPGIVKYCNDSGFGYLLQPYPYKTLSDTLNEKRSKKNKVGFNMKSRDLKIQCERWLKQWLLDDRSYVDNEGIKHERTTIDHIYSPRLLKEISVYDREDGNFDYLSSMFGLMLWLQEERLKPLEEERTHDIERELKEFMQKRKKSITVRNKFTIF